MTDAPAPADRADPAAGRALPGAADAEAGATLDKVARRLVPFLGFLYVLGYLDRINISFASLKFPPGLGITDEVYGLGSGIFYLGYGLFELPSNLILQRVGRAGGSPGS